MEHQKISKRHRRRHPQSDDGAIAHTNRGRRVAALLLGTALFGGALTVTPIPADSPLNGAPSAASAIEDHHGPGVNWGNGVHIYGAGSFLIDGKYVFCVEPWIRSGSHLPEFVGSAAIPGNSSDGVTVAATTGAPLRQISYLIARYGQTSDNLQAAAVALAIWEIRGADGRGNAGYQAEVARVRSSVGPEVVSLAQRIAAEAATWSASAQTSDVGETPSIEVVASQPYRGTVSVPLGTLELQIEGGVLADGTTSRSWNGSGAPAGTSLAWEGRPPADGWERYYQVRFTGSYLEIPETVQWGDGHGSQSSITAVEPRVLPLRAAYAHLDTAWAPVVSSIVTSKFVSVGEPHSDDVIFAAAPATAETSGEWRWRVNAQGAREWMPVKARVTAYGPFLTDPALNPSPEAPAGAPVAARSSLTTDSHRDHSTPQRYEFVFDDTIAEQGYYTYKWDIVGSDQDASIVGADECAEPNPEQGCRVIPSDYYFTDGFGAEGETQVGKMQQGFTTKLSTHETSLGASFTDTITLPDMQNWLRDDLGNRVPLTLTGTAYLAPGIELAQSASVPSDSVPLGVVQVTSDPSLNGQQLTSAAITVPVATSRAYQHVTMRWCIVEEDQQERARGMWEERCDDFGVPDESARLVHPEVRTEAVPLTTIYDPITDTAIVNGPIPEHTELVFELYKQPVAGDPKGGAEPTLDPAVDPAVLPGIDDTSHASVWSEDEVAKLGDEPLCIDENRIGRTEAVPVTPGNNDDAHYVSPGLQVTQAGTYWWIESLIHTDPESQDETVILSGACGLPNETTRVDSPRVTTLATETVFVGEAAHDLAQVSGPVPGTESGTRTELTFQAFKQQGNLVSCTEEELVFDLSEPIVIDVAGEYPSAEVSFTEVGTYFWVETLRYVFEDGSSEVVHIGECGLPNETTRVADRPVIALTGAGTASATIPWVVGGAATLLIGAGAALLAYRHHRRQTKHVDESQSVRECAG